MTGPEVHRPSPIPWVGTCPRHWKTVRLKATVRFCQNGLWGEEPDGVHDIVCVRVADFDRVKRRVALDDPTYRSVPASRRTGRLLRADDLLIEKSGGGEKQPVGCVVHFDHPVEAICSNFVARMPVEPGHDARFLSYVHASLYSLGLTERSIKQTTGIQNLDAEAYLDERVEIPPLAEQRSIAVVLDRKTAAIDALIAKKERQIDLLQEKRQALITQAVTRGLDPKIPLRLVRAPWFDQVPSHWTVTAVKRTAATGANAFTDGDWIEAPFVTDTGIRLLQTGNVGIGRFKEQGFRYISERTFRELRCTEVRPSDVLICRLDGPVGRACLAPDLGCRMITSVDNAILRPSRQFDAGFLVYVLSSQPYLDWVGALCRVGGGHRFRISRSMLGEFEIPAPPLAEQQEIRSYLDRTCQSIDGVVTTIGRHVELLREYRQALISAAVTGKIEIPAEEAA